MEIISLIGTTQGWSMNDFRQFLKDIPTVPQKVKLRKCWETVGQLM
jgi:hypothetical protein